MGAASLADRRTARRLMLVATVLAGVFCLLGWFSSSAQAAVTLVGDTTQGTGAGATSVTISTPGGTVGGEFELVQIQGTSGSPIATPSGWTQLYSIFAPYGYSVVLWKQASASEPSSYTFSLPTSEVAAAEFETWRGTDFATSPINSWNFGSGSGTSATAPSVTTTVNNAIVIAGVTWGAAVTSSPPSGTTPIFTFTTGGATKLTSEGAYFQQALAGATGNQVFTSSASASWGVKTIALRPDTTAPAAPTITSSPPSPGAGRSPSWSFTGEQYATFQCQLTGPSGVVSAWSSCTSPQSYDLTGDPDGTYTFSVKATDEAGNTGAAATSSYTLDATPPAAPTITGSPASPGNSRSPSWSFNDTDPSATFRCQLTGPSGVISSWTSCTSPQSYDLTGDPDGTYTFSVTATDQAGNTSSTTTSSYTLDTTPPATPNITSAPSSPGNSRAPSWSFSDADGSVTFKCELSGPGLAPTWTSCTSPRSYDLSGDPDGTYTFSVEAIDAAGNASPAASAGYTLDTTPPAAPSITAQPSSPGNSRSPSWSFNDSDASASFKCKLSGPGLSPSWTSCTSPQSYDLTGKPDGVYTFSVEATDPAGNTGPASSGSYTLDTTPPAAPSLDSQPPSPSSDTSPSWSFSGEPGVTFECQLTSGPTVVSAWATCTNPKSYDLSGRPDGTYTFSVEATDQAGNTGPATSGSYTLNRALPPKPTITASPRSPGNSASPMWSFSSTESGDTFQCQLTRGSTVLSAWSSCTTPQIYDLTGQPDGTYTFSVRSVNVAGTSPAATNDYVYDTTAPAAPSITSGPGSAGSSSSPSWSFSGEPGATFQCELTRGSTIVSAPAPCTSPHSYNLSSQPDGTYTFTVVATDQAGNTGPPTTTNYQLDRTLPPAPAITAAPHSPGSDGLPSWSFSSSELGDTFQCQLTRGSTIVSGWSACSNSRTYDLSGGPDGSYTFSVRAINVVGAVGAPSTSTYTLDTTPPPPPVITSGPGSHGTDRTPTWSFTSASGTTTECRLTRGGSAVSAWAPCTSPRGFDLTKQSNGGYTFAVRALDAVGNTSPSATSDYQLSPADDQPGGSISGPPKKPTPPTSPSPSPSSPPAATPPTRSVTPLTTSVTPPTAAPTPIHHRAPVKFHAAAATPPAQGASTSGAGSTSGGRGKPLPKLNLHAPSLSGQLAVARPRPHHHASSSSALDDLTHFVTQVVRVVARNAPKAVFPFLLLLLVVAFLSIQGRIDRNDPKLALAPQFADPALDFGPPPKPA